MKNIKLHLFKIATAATFTFTASALLVSSSFAQGTPAKVGAFVRGSDDHAAKAFEEGMQLALAKKSPAALDIKFLNASDGTSPDAAALKALVSTDHAPLVLYWSVDALTPVAPYLNESQVVGLASWHVTEKVPYLGQHIFGFGYSIESSFKALAKFAGNKLHSNRICVVSSAENTYDTQSKAFIEESKSLGNTIVFDEKAATDAAYPALITRAQKETCDTILAALPATGSTAFVKAARAASYKGHILVGDTLFAPEIAALGKDAEGIYMVQAWSDDAEFKSLYAAKYGSTPDGVTLGAAALGYDTINCVQNILPPLDSGGIRNSFLSTPCEGLTGATRFSGERIAQRAKRVVTVKAGQLSVAG